MADPSCYDFSGAINGIPNRCVCNDQYCYEPACTAGGGIWTDGCNSCSCEDIINKAPTVSPATQAPTTGSPACFDQDGSIGNEANSCVCDAVNCNETVCTVAGGLWTDGCTCSCAPFTCSDDPNYVYTTNSGKTKDCRWIGKKPGKRCDKPGAKDSCGCSCLDE